MLPALRPNRLSLSLGLIAGLAMAFGAGMWYERRRAAGSLEWMESHLLSQAIDSVRVNALDSLSGDELIRRAVAGMLRELNDPYAALLEPEGLNQYRGNLLGEGRGLGLSLRQENEGASVVRVAPGSPAHEAGIRSGDRILLVDGTPTSEGWGPPRDSASAPPPSQILTVWRLRTNDTGQYVVARSLWHQSAVADQGLLLDSVGYVRLATVSARAAGELEETVEELVARGARSLVLDLRGNGGGLFEEGVKAAGLFLPRGAVVAYLAGRDGTSGMEHRAPVSRWPSMPLVVLVDGGTASAAEVIAAAVRQHDRALLVGAPTYGKGVVQRVVRLSDDLSLRLTTARWLTPNGTALLRREGQGTSARGGLVPDVLLDDAQRRDLTSVPAGWNKPASTTLDSLADAVIVHAVRESWAITPLNLLEARMRMALVQMIPSSVTQPVERAAWVSAATQMSMQRMLEVQRASDLRLRHGTRVDPALHAGLEVLAPGVEAMSMLPSVLPARLGRGVIGVP